jgi:hypothetical protein
MVGGCERIFKVLKLISKGSQKMPVESQKTGSVSQKIGKVCEKIFNAVKKFSML